MPGGGGSDWSAFDRVAPGADEVTVLTAAKDDLLDQQRRLMPDADPALAIDAQVDFRDHACDLVVRVTGDRERSREVNLSRYVIGLAHQGPTREKPMPPLTLLACALVARDRLGQGWRAKRIGDAVAPGEELFAESREVFRFTESASRIENALEGGRDVLLVGVHGSGKTVHAANFAQKEYARGAGLIWLDLSDPADGPESIVATLLRMERRERYFLVIDSLHANMPVVESLLTCVSALRSEFGLTVQVLATSLPVGATGREQRRSWADGLRDFVRVPIEGRELINRLVAESGLSPQEQQQILALVGGDVHIATTALSLYQLGGRVPSRRDLQIAYTRGVEDDRARKALYHFACLGACEMDISEYEAGLRGKDVVADLLAKKVIRRADRSYTIGPRARARLILREALENWDAEARWGRPAELAWRYLQSSGERMMRATLARIDSGGISGRWREPTHYLLSTWDMLERLGRLLDERCEQDPTWGGGLTAAVFAGMALARLDHEESWLRVAEYVREHWRYGSDGDLPEPVAASPADVAEFDRIAAMMAEEDVLLMGAPHLAGQPASDIDFGIFYRTWALALLLCFESTAPASRRDNNRIADLVTMAERRIHDGYYYPRRVPWLTARMVLGLCLAGQRYSIDDSVRQACQWLRRPLRDGGALERWWRSGSGSWNSDEATTATCLTALLRAGVPVDDDHTRDVMTSAFAWLDDRESAWTAVGREVDLAQVLEAVLLRRDRIDPRHVEDLLGRMLSALNDRVSLPSGPQDNVRVSLVTAQLTTLVWTTVWGQFASLFEDMVEATSGGTRTEPTGTGNGAIGGHQTGGGSANGRPAGQQWPLRIDGMVTLTSWELGAWQKAADQLRLKIGDQIENRAAVSRQLPGARETAERLRHYQRLREDCEQLTQRLAQAVPLDVLVSLDNLGQEVCALAWPRLPWPNGRPSSAGDEPDDGAVQA